MRLLLVEDDERLSASLTRGLTEAGYSVDHAGTGDAALDAAETTAYDLVVLDVMLPGRLDGVAVCRALRRRRHPGRVLMLTALDAVDERVAGLEAGADDYLPKPFAFRELLARCASLTRRHLDDRGSVLRAGELEHDRSSGRTTVGGVDVALTARETDVLVYFLHNRGRLLSRNQVEEHVWHGDVGAESNLVEVYVLRLRRRLRAAGMADPFTTVRGSGYRLDA